MTGKSGGAIGLSIEVIFIATLGIAAVGLVINANYTNWDATSKLMFQTVMVIVIAVAFLLIVLNRAGYKVNL
jgi:hypothetical protein